ncbi:unnamed protein product [Pelagomonas calceolata]|uniref:Uncharacterized protein n=1 Tax=Pelagomonas calceolata TaxID=35677 RepID=A0A8J2T370_9STRA|nr:unnamed protein product [Pelagomonas calceolata]
MVLPDYLSNAAGHGDVAPIEAWLNEGNDVNERGGRGHTMLLICAGTPHTRTRSHVDLARLLIKHGADVNICAEEQPPALGLSPLHYACDRLVDHSADMVALLLDAKANVHCRAQPNPEDASYPADTPLGMTLLGFPNEGSSEERFTIIYRITTLLLRAGASLDAVSDERTAEMELRAAEEANPALRDSDTFVQVKALINGVRAAGSWKAFCRQDHKRILRLRSLITRGRARERLAATPAIKFILRRADNGVLWTILSFWQATN